MILFVTKRRFEGIPALCGRERGDMRGIVSPDATLGLILRLVTVMMLNVVAGGSTAGIYGRRLFKAACASSAWGSLRRLCAVLCVACCRSAGEVFRGTAFRRRNLGAIFAFRGRGAGRMRGIVPPDATLGSILRLVTVSKGRRSVCLEQLLFAYGCDELFEIEWFEVGYVLEITGAIGGKGRGEHCRGFRPALAEACVMVLDDICAFAGAVAYEQAWALLKVFGEACFVDDGRSGFGDLSIGRRSFAALRMT